MIGKTFEIVLSQSFERCIHLSYCDSDCYVLYEAFYLL